MKKTSIQAIIISVIMTLLMLSPYAPISHDASSVMISATLQIAAFASLLFVPLGLLWLVAIKAKSDGLAKACQIMTFIVSIIAVVITFFAASQGLGPFRGSMIFGLMIVFTYICFIRFKIRPLIRANKALHTAFPLYLILIPILVTGARTFLIPLAVNNSRNHNIEAAQVIIDSLEDYYNQNGSYPATLNGVYNDFPTGTAGVQGFIYEPQDDAYNLFFEHFNDDLFAREIVMYNKNNQHIIRSHPGFRFHLSQEEFEQYRGYFEAIDLDQQGWKSFLFD